MPFDILRITLVEAQDDFSVTACVKPHTTTLEVEAKRWGVVDLPIEYERRLPIVAQHRLLAVLDVYDGEAHHAHRHVQARIYCEGRSLAVGAPPSNSRTH
jgi:hypothetical protein